MNNSLGNKFINIRQASERLQERQRSQASFLSHVTNSPLSHGACFFPLCPPHLSPPVSPHLFPLVSPPCVPPFVPPCVPPLCPPICTPIVPPQCVPPSCPTAHFVCFPQTLYGLFEDAVRGQGGPFAAVVQAKGAKGGAPPAELLVDEGMALILQILLMRQIYIIYIYSVCAPRPMISSVSTPSAIIPSVFTPSPLIVPCATPVVSHVVTPDCLPILTHSVRYL